MYYCPRLLNFAFNYDPNIYFSSEEPSLVRKPTTKFILCVRPGDFVFCSGTPNCATLKKRNTLVRTQDLRVSSSLSQEYIIENLSFIKKSVLTIKDSPNVLPDTIDLWLTLKLNIPSDFINQNVDLKIRTWFLHSLGS